MRRADRLFQIVALLQARRAMTAGQIADELSVSVRTVYRDVADLVESGVPIEGEAGVGYRLARGYDLPPMTFDREEIEALVAGARFVASHGDEALGQAAIRALHKIEAVLPAPLRAVLQSTAIYAPSRIDRPSLSALEVLREAIASRNKVSLRYVRGDGQSSERVLRPLGLQLWGTHWSLAAFCELRGDFRSFRVERMSEVSMLPEQFGEEDGAMSLSAYVRHVEAEAGHFIRDFGPKVRG